MRTTVTLDDDVFRAAKTLARERGLSLGAALSDLVRRGLRPAAPVEYRNDFPVFEVREGTPVFGPEETAAALDDE